jgi:hypothetical protein
MTARLKFSINFIIILGLAITLCAPTSSTTLAYNFKCKSNDANSTMMHESRFRESRLEDGRNTLGYLAGSFNYLQKGKIEFKENIGYQEGHNEVNSDSLVLNNMDVFFEGEKGISEFYAKGFFPDGRALDSKSAIRFEYFSSNISRTDINYSANKFQVNADAIMGFIGKSDVGYDFSYNATVANGVVDTRNTMGWTNETFAKRIDWEQTALMKGNITVDNRFLASNLFDLPCSTSWLPC